MVTYGKGGWTWETLYNMPVFLRSYYMKLLGEALKKESSDSESALSSDRKQILRPNIPQARG